MDVLRELIDVSAYTASESACAVMEASSADSSARPISAVAAVLWVRSLGLGLGSPEPSLVNLPDRRARWLLNRDRESNEGASDNGYSNGRGHHAA